MVWRGGSRGPEGARTEILRGCEDGGGDRHCIRSRCFGDLSAPHFSAEIDDDGPAHELIGSEDGAAWGGSKLLGLLGSRDSPG